MMATKLILLLLTEQSTPEFKVDAFSPPRIANSRVRPLHNFKQPAFKTPQPTPKSGRVAGTSRHSSLAPVDFAAGGAIVLSTMIGMTSEKFNFSGGHVLTLLSAAFLSNASSAVPTDNILYDVCWSIFLPSSLVFALLSTSTSSISEGIGPSKQSSSKETSINSSTVGMIIPFISGSIGSIIGCFVSFLLIKFHDVKATAVMAGCLCASYIGGTVNFFAAAKILIPMFNCNETTGGGIGSLFGSMAAADLVVMAIYFSFLSFVSKSKVLQRLFPGRGGGDDTGKVPSEVKKQSKSRAEESTGNTHTRRNTLSGSSFAAVVLASSISICSVLAATCVEEIISNIANLPGTMCAFLAMFGLMAEKLIGMGISRKSNMNRSSGMESFLLRSLEKVAAVSPKLSNLCFYLLFASVGTTADISAAIGSGPRALAFASLALVIHCAIVLVGTFVGGRLLKRKSTLQEMLTASNAAIGGPSTAAAFAADLTPITSSDRFNGQLRRSLIVGATVWGVFGYAIGTAVGVMLAKALMVWV